MSSRPDIVRPFLFNPALHGPDAQEIAAVTLSFLGEKARNEAQLAALRPVAPFLNLPAHQRLGGSDPFAEQCVCYRLMPNSGRPLSSYTSVNGEPIFRDVLYLFNVILAFEWNPGPVAHQQIRSAMAKASDFLYDTTNGYMAIGQVVIGGHRLMDGADIQVMASNRIHPRSWIDSLNQAEKFKPIRVGRGLWQKDSDLLLGWDTPEGYRTLIHEWGHYAFGLVDRHLTALFLSPDPDDGRFWLAAAAPDPADPDQPGIAAPAVALPVETLMASTQISEFIAGDEIAQRIRDRYVLIDDTALDGPAELPLPLPQVVDLAAGRSPFAVTPDRIAIEPTRPEDLPLPLGDLLSLLPRPARHMAHWVYLLKAPFSDDQPAAVIAQGKVSRKDLAAGFRLAGGAAGDRVVVVSQVDAEVVVHQAALADLLGPWEDVTPPCFQGGGDGLLFVDVIPEPMQGDAAVSGKTRYPMQANLWVQVEATSQPAQAAVYPAGQRRRLALEWLPDHGQAARPVEVDHLDGHVLLLWAPAGGGDGRRPLFLCSYSQGGGPNTSAGGRVPITGGSADGNAMVFFKENATPLLIGQSGGDDEGVRVVTTTLTAGRAPGAGPEPRSYIFSVAANQPLDAYRPALVLYYDREAPRRGGDLVIARWDGGARDWQALRTLAPADLPYLAIPLYNRPEPTAAENFAPSLMRRPGEAAPPEPPGDPTGSIAPPAYIERYRIFWARPAAERRSPTDTSSLPDPPDTAELGT